MGNLKTFSYGKRVRFKQIMRSNGPTRALIALKEGFDELVNRIDDPEARDLLRKYVQAIATTHARCLLKCVDAEHAMKTQWEKDITKLYHELEKFMPAKGDGFESIEANKDFECKYEGSMMQHLWG